MKDFAETTVEMLSDKLVETARVLGEESAEKKMMMFQSSDLRQTIAELENISASRQEHIESLQRVRTAGCDLYQAVDDLLTKIEQGSNLVKEMKALRVAHKKAGAYLQDVPF